MLLHHLQRRKPSGHYTIREIEEEAMEDIIELRAHLIRYG
jgi:hypothetical protein